MRLTIPRQPLREALSHVIQAVPKRAEKPILENVLLRASERALELLGTDLAVSVRCRVHCEAEEPGVVAVNAHVLHDFVRDLDSESVTLSGARATCFVEGDSAHCELATVDPEEFPTVREFGNASAVVPSNAFARLVSQTAFAAAREAGRYAMHGVLVELTDGVLRLAATDGRRLALSSAEVDAKAQRPAIVPPRALQMMARMGSGDVELDLFDATWIAMRAGAREVFARQLDGEFPRYAAVLPQKSEHMLDLDIAEFVRTVALVSSVAGEDARAVWVQPLANNVELVCTSSGRGEARARMDATITGMPHGAAFNPDYVLDGIKRADGERFTMYLHDRTSPARFELGERFVYVVMPITLDG